MYGVSKGDKHCTVFKNHAYKLHICGIKRESMVSCRKNVVGGQGGGVGQDHVQQLLLTLHSFHHGVFHREKNMLATNAFVF